MKNSKFQSAKLGFAALVVSQMTFDNIKNILNNLNLPVGKNKTIAQSTLVNAIVDKKANCSIHLTIRTPRDANNFQTELFNLKTRTHKADEAPYVRDFTPVQS